MKTFPVASVAGWALGCGGAALVIVLASVVTGHAVVQTGGDATVPYPEGFRMWVHVKSGLVSARHPDFAQTGGFRHIYANREAVAGYRTGAFPEGSIIVVDWIDGQDENGMFSEALRRRVDVMVKDRTRFAATSGWGFERFKGDSKTERLVTSAAKQCVACHSGPGARDLVFSKFRE